MVPALARYAGVAAVATLWSTVGAAMLRTGFPVLGERPLSWLAEDPAAALLFSTGLVVGALLLVVFALDVRGRHPVGAGFLAAMVGGMACQVVAGLVSIGGGRVENRVHTAAALALGASLPVLMWRFAAAQPAGRWRRVAYALFWAEAAACVVGIVLSQRSVAPLAEVIPAATFHLWVVVLTLRRPGSGPAARSAAQRSQSSGRENGPMVMLEHDGPISKPIGTGTGI